MASAGNAFASSLPAERDKLQIAGCEIGRQVTGMAKAIHLIGRGKGELRAAPDAVHFHNAAAACTPSAAQAARRESEPPRRVRMRWLGILAAAAAVLNLAFAQSAQDQKTGKTISFLKDDLGQQWCAYASESQFKAQIKERTAFVVGGADYADGRIVRVRVTETDETGDWTVSDDYSFDSDGNIESLKRVINILPEDSSEEQLFIIKNGKAVKQRSVRHKLRNLMARQKPVDGFQEPPVITSAANFPFADLIGGKREAVWSQGSVCLP